MKVSVTTDDGEVIEIYTLPKIQLGQPDARTRALREAAAMSEVGTNEWAEESNVRVHFQPEAWQRDYAVPVDDAGPDTWLVSTETAEMIQSALARDVDLDFVKEDDFAPRWVAEWSGPFTITVVED